MQLDCPHCSLPLSLVDAVDELGQCSACGGALASDSMTPRATTATTATTASTRAGSARFELLEQIGAGSFGVVWKARDRELGRLVALKLLHPTLVGAGQARERFVREARTVAQLRHPGIVSIHEVFDLSGRPAMVSDLVSGRTLDQHRGGRPLAPRDAAALVLQAAEALDYAHSMGVVHRDVKPTNLMVETATALSPSKALRLVVLDFGLARADENDATLTTDGQLLGTPAYMSPEQALGRREDVDGRSDIYSLGVVLYELLTGSTPFRGSSVSVLRQLVDQEPKSPRSLDPELPRDLESICLKAMAKAASDRYATARELADDLRRYSSGLPVTARRLRASERAARWARRNPMTAVLGGSVALLLILVAAVATVSALRLQRERNVALENLYRANLSEAQARRTTTLPGRHFDSLRALERAAAHRPSAEVRDEVIAALGLTDLEFERSWRFRTPGGEQIDGVGFDPGFSRCVVQNPEDSMRVFALPDSTLIATLPHQGDRVQLSPDGRFLFTFSGKGDIARLHDLATRREILSTRACGWSFRGVFSADGAKATVCLEDGAFVQLELPSGRELLRVRAPRPPHHAVVDGFGRRVAMTASDGAPIEIFDLATGLSRVTEPALVGLPCDWSSDGSLVATIGSTTSQILEVETGVQIPLIRQPPDMQSATFHPSGSLLATRAWDGLTRLWDTATGLEVVQIPGYYVQFSADGTRLAFASRDQIGWWRIANLETCRTVRSRGEIEGGGPYDVTVSRDGRRFVTQHEDGARLWDIASAETIARVPSGRTVAVSLDSLGAKLFTIGDQGVQVWPLTEDADHARVEVGAPRSLVTGRFSSSRTNFAFSANGRWAAIPYRRAYALRIDLESGDTLSVGPHPVMHAATVSSDGRWIVTSTNFGEGVRVWDAETRELRAELPAGHHAYVSFSPEGRWLATQSMGHAPQLWRAPDFELARTHERPDGYRFLGRDDRIGTVDTRGTVHLARTEDEAPIATLRAPVPTRVVGLDSSYDGRWLVTAAPHLHLLQIWDLNLVRSELGSRRLDWIAPN